MNLNNGVTYSGLFNTVSGNFDNIASYNATFINTSLLGTTTTDLTPLQTVTTDADSNLTTIAYTPNNVSLTFMTRDSSGNCALNQLTCNYLIVNNSLVLYGLRITPLSDNTSVFSVTNAANNFVLINYDTTALKTTHKATQYYPDLTANTLAQFDNNGYLIGSNTISNNLGINATIYMASLTPNALLQLNGSYEITSSNTVSQNVTFSNTVDINGSLGTYGNPVPTSYFSAAYTQSFESYDIQNTSSGNLNFYRGATFYDSAIVNLLALSGSGSTVYVVGTNASPKFAVYNNSGVRKFSVSTTTGAVSTTNNALDDGSGNMTCQGTMTIYSTTSTTKFQVLNVMTMPVFKVDSTNNIVSTLSGTVLEDGFGNAVIDNNLTVNNNLTINGSGEVLIEGAGNGNKFYVEDGSGAVIFNVDTYNDIVTIGSGASCNLVVQTGNTSLQALSATTANFSSTITTALTASQLVQTNSSSQLTTSNTLPSGCSATNMTLTTPTFSGVATYGTGNSTTTISNATVTINNNVGNGNWGVITIEGREQGGNVNVLHLTNNATIGICGSAILFNGYTGSATSQASLAFTGVNFTVSQSFLPSTDNALTCGGTANRWSNVFSYNIGFGGQTTFSTNIALQAPNSSTYQAQAYAWNTYSNRRMKKHIKQIENPLELINKITGVEFFWRKGHGDNTEKNLKSKIVQHGFIAEDLNNVLPHACSVDENNEVNGVDYSKVIPLLVESIKSLSKQVNELKSEINNLKKK
jgi:hypothetical protein